MMNVSFKISLVLLLFVTACHSPQRQDGPRTAGKAVAPPAKTVADERKEQLAALDILRRQLSDTSGTAFAEAFDFPVPEAAFHPIIEAEGFARAYEAQGGKLSRPLFLEYFSQISESLELPEFHETLRQINSRTLQNTDSTQLVARAGSSVSCVRYYSLQLRQGELRIQYGSDHNDAYLGNDENDASVCEWAAIWTFRYRDGMWRFVSMFQAG